jgi:hypothetical protein
MKRHRGIAFLSVVAVLACSSNESRQRWRQSDAPDGAMREARTFGASTSHSGSTRAVQQSEPSIDVDAGRVQVPTVQPSALARALDDALGEKTVLTGEKLAIAAFADKYLDGWSKPFPKPRKFIIEKAEEGWSVSVVDLKTAATGELSRGYTLHVTGRNGKYSVREIAAW